MNLELPFHPKNCLISKGGDNDLPETYGILRGVFVVLRILNRSPRRWKWWQQRTPSRPGEGRSTATYSQEIDALIKRVAGSFSDLTHPLFLARERQQVGYVVFTSDRGLCGAFNSHVIRRAEMEMSKEEEAGLIIIGRKGRDYFRRRNYNILSEFVNIGDDPAVDQARGIARTLVDLYTGNIVDEVNLVYTEFISTGKQQPSVYKFLPPLTNPRLIMRVRGYS